MTNDLTSEERILLEGLLNVVNTDEEAKAFYKKWVRHIASSHSYVAALKHDLNKLKHAPENIFPFIVMMVVTGLEGTATRLRVMLHDLDEEIRKENLAGE